MPRRVDTVPALQELNTTELWHMAARLGIEGASPATPRLRLIEAITRLEHLPFADPTDAERRRCSNFWVDHWSVVQMQMQKPHCPNCHLRLGQRMVSRMDRSVVDSFCSDMEFIDCYLDNKHRIG